MFPKPDRPIVGVKPATIVDRSETELAPPDATETVKLEGASVETACRCRVDERTPADAFCAATRASRLIKKVCDAVPNAEFGVLARLRVMGDGCVVLIDIPEFCAITSAMLVALKLPTGIDRAMLPLPTLTFGMEKACVKTRLAKCGDRVGAGAIKLHKFINWSCQSLTQAKMIIRRTKCDAFSMP